MKFSLRSLLLAVAVLSLLLATNFLGCVGFHYPRWVDNDPLNGAQQVVRISANEIGLADGRSFTLNLQPTELKSALAESQYFIEPVEQSDGEVIIFVRQDITRCGTPWVRPINVYWFPVDVPSFDRAPLASGHVVQASKSNNAASP